MSIITRVFTRSEDPKLYKQTTYEPYNKEKQLEDNIERNCQRFLGMYFIGRQIRLPYNNEVYILDMLAFDYDGRPVIIELKKGEDRLVLIQMSEYAEVFRYFKFDLTKLIINKMRDSYNISIELDDINWEEIRFVCISGDFSKDILVKSKRFRDFEFIEYSLIKDGEDVLIRFLEFKDNKKMIWNNINKRYETSQEDQEQDTNDYIEEPKINVILNELQKEDWSYSTYFKNLINWAIEELSVELIPNTGDIRIAHYYYETLTKTKRIVFSLSKGQNKLVVTINLPLEYKSTLEYNDDIIDFSKPLKHGMGSTGVYVYNDQTLKKAKELIQVKVNDITSTGNYKSKSENEHKKKEDT